jgi:hypothetical protein
MQDDTPQVPATQKVQPEVKNTAQTPQQPLVAPQTPSNPAPPPKPKKRLKTKILIALIISLTLIGLGIAGYFYFNWGRFFVEDEECADDCVEKSGVINEDEVWSGTIYVTGDIDVMEGVTLTILPGTIVKIALTDDQHKGRDEPVTGDIYFPKDPPFYEKEKITISILGTLNAIGTPDNMIVFTSESANPTTQDWGGLNIFHGKLEYAIVEYAQYNNIQHSSDVVISNNIIRNSLGCCIGIGHSNQVSPQILNNDIYNCGHEGIDYAGGSALIKGNYFHLGDRRLQPEPERGGLGIVVYKNAYPTIEDNVFEKLTTAIYFHGNSKYPEEQGEKVIVKNNRIENNEIAFGIDPNYLFEVVVKENNRLINNRENEVHR